MAISFHKGDKVILIETQTEVTIQELVNAIREWEDELCNMEVEKIMDAAGKQDLGGGVLVGITLELVNDWRIQFEDRSPPDTIACKVSGGNLVATNSYNNNPIKPSAYTQVTISQSTSAAQTEGTSPEAIADAILDEDVSDHTTPGSLGEYITKVKKWVGWLRSLL